MNTEREDSCITIKLGGRWLYHPIVHRDKDGFEDYLAYGVAFVYDGVWIRFK